MLYTPFLICFPFFFFSATATTEIYTLSLHDALPIFATELRLERQQCCVPSGQPGAKENRGLLLWSEPGWPEGTQRSEEHTSELQSHSDLVCRLLLEKKKKTIIER